MLAKRIWDTMNRNEMLNNSMLGYDDDGSQSMEDLLVVTVMQIGPRSE